MMPTTVELKKKKEKKPALQPKAVPSSHSIPLLDVIRFNNASQGCSGPAPREGLASPCNLGSLD